MVMNVESNCTFSVRLDLNPGTGTQFSRSWMGRADPGHPGLGLLSLSSRGVPRPLPLQMLFDSPALPAPRGGVWVPREELFFFVC